MRSYETKQNLRGKTRMKLTTVSIYEDTKKLIDKRYSEIIKSKHDKETAEMWIKKASYDEKLKAILQIEAGGNL